MAEPVYRQGWSPDDIAWEKFDAAKVQPWLLAAVKAAALIEFNAPDYVGYLKQVFPDPAFHPTIEQWGREETQHGRVLGRWAELADPSFKLEDAAARFRAGYRPAHFDNDKAGSVRGSKRGEMVARCVVESGTSTYYTAIKEAAEEPVLKEIAGRIAADEFRHYKLFYETEKGQDDPHLPFWRRMLVAAGRMTESDDDESAYAYYAANVPQERQAAEPYDRKTYSAKMFAAAMRVYRRPHIERLTRMVAKAVGADPQGRLVRLAGAAIWRMLRTRADLARVQPAGAA